MKGSIAFVSLLSLINISVAFAEEPSVAPGEHITTCTGVENDGHYLKVELEKGTPNPAEHDPRFTYYAQLTTFVTEADLQSGENWIEQTNSEPLASTGGNPATYWNGHSLSKANLKLTVDGKESLLEVPTEAPDGSGNPASDPNLAHVALDCE
jgi:hypothetical protein